MPIHLPDINVLIALHDTDHVHHSIASDWLQKATLSGWATCSITEIGLVRLLAHPSIPNHVTNPQIAASYLVDLKSRHSHSFHFLSDTVEFTDLSIFNHQNIQGHKQITDTYLLGLCQKHGATLVTLDTRLSTRAIKNPHARLLRLLH